MANGGVAEEAVVVWSGGSDTAVSFITAGHCLSAFIKIIMRVHNWEAEGRASSLLPKHRCRPRYHAKPALISKIIFLICSSIVLHMVLLSVWVETWSLPCLTQILHICVVSIFGWEFWYCVRDGIKLIGEFAMCSCFQWPDRIKHDTIIQTYLVLGVGGKYYFQQDLQISSLWFASPVSWKNAAPLLIFCQKPCEICLLSLERGQELFPCLLLNRFPLSHRVDCLPVCYCSLHKNILE